MLCYKHFSSGGSTSIQLGVCNFVESSPSGMVRIPSRQQFLGDRLYKSSAVAEMGDRGHNRHGPKRGGGAVPLLRSAGNPSDTM